MSNSSDVQGTDLPPSAGLYATPPARGQLRTVTIDARRAGLGLDDLAALAARRAPHRALRHRILQPLP